MGPSADVKCRTHLGPHCGLAVGSEISQCKQVVSLQHTHSMPTLSRPTLQGPDVAYISHQYWSPDVHHGTLPPPTDMEYGKNTTFKCSLIHKGSHTSSSTDLIWLNRGSFNFHVTEILNQSPSSSVVFLTM